MISKKMGIIFSIYIVIFVILVTYTTFPYGHDVITKTHFVKIVDVDKKKLFNLMSDVKNYPTIFPDNYISVSIINKTGNVIFTQETVQEAGIKITLDVKHTIIPYEQHIVEILHGDANGTRITASFDEIDSKTRITTDVEMHLKGILTPFGLLPQSNIEHAMNTIIDSFTKHLK